MKYHFVLHKEPDGYWAKCIEFDACTTQGDTLDDLIGNMEEALNLYLDESPDSNVSHPLPDETIDGDDIIAVKVHPEIAFSVLLRYYRKEKGLTQNDMKQLLNLKNIFSYQRLEKHPNPRLSTLAEIKKIIPEISIDYILQE